VKDGDGCKISNQPEATALEKSEEARHTISEEGRKSGKEALTGRK
jgi:hypothetical protein